MRSRRTRASAALAAVALIVTVAAAPANAAPNNNTVRKLTNAVTPDGVLNHLEALQAVADANGGTRASGRPGYKASVDYVVAQLEAAGYSPTVQEFMFPYVEENSQLIRRSPNPRTFVNGVDFLRNRFDSGTPEGTATGPLVNVDLVLDPSGPPNTSSSGCDVADFAGFPAGAVALLQRGTCGFNVKALNAQAAGASAVIIMNEGQPGRTGLTNMIGDATGLAIPAIFTTFEAGLNLAQTPGATVTVTVDFTAEQRATYNVIAETAGGNADNVVMAGAHLDSVQAGAGINDNGSGSAGLLETAIQMAKVKTPNKVRFAWWGGEESGLLGSTFYVAQLTARRARTSRLYLNFDMIASPNYTFGIYDGDNSGGTAAPGFIPPARRRSRISSSASSRPAASRSRTRSSPAGRTTARSSREGSPPAACSPAPRCRRRRRRRRSGVASPGHSWTRATTSSATTCAATARTPRCSPSSREDYELVGNVNVHALDVNSDAIAASVLTFAYDTSSVNAVAGKPGKSKGLFRNGNRR